MKSICVAQAAEVLDRTGQEQAVMADRQGRNEPDKR
jgi:hypothetical protein